METRFGTEPSTGLSNTNIYNTKNVTKIIKIASINLARQLQETSNNMWVKHYKLNNIVGNWYNN